MSRPITCKDALLATLLGGIAFSLYVRTLLPGLIPNDGAEFQTLAYAMGHAHTTGYSIYLLLARLFITLPVGDIVYRVNLFSAFWGGVTIAFLYLSAKIFTGNRWGSAISTVAMAVSTRFWSQAIIAEVYTAGTAFMAAILFLVLFWNQTRQGKSLFFAGLLGGMSIGVHGSVLLLAPAVLVLLLFEQRKLAGSMKPAAAGAVCGTLLFIAAFVFIDTHQTNASIMNTYISSASRWGVTADQLERPIGRFVFLVFAQQWRPMMFVDPSEVARGNFHLLVQVLREDFALPVHLLSLIGFCLTWLRKPKLAVFFTVALATHLIFTLNYKIGDIYVFFLSFFEIMLLFCAEGASRFFDLLNRLPAKSQRLVHPLAVVIMFVACLPPYMISPRISSLKMGEFREDFMNLPSNQELETWHTMVRFNAADLPKNAVVLADWYNIYAYTYAAQVELGRPDLLFIEAYPFAYGSNRMADSLLQFLREKMEKGYPVVALQRYDELSDRGFTVQSLPVGVTEMFLIAEK